MNPSPSYTRLLGHNELSYFLPSRADGVNDMYCESIFLSSYPTPSSYPSLTVHIGLRASSSVFNSSRLSLVWSILRLRHPLLASTVLVQPGQYDQVQFQYIPPSTLLDALSDAQANMHFIDSATAQTPTDTLDQYLNGSRTLSNSRLSYLFATTAHFAESSENIPDEHMHECNIILCAAHFIGDGMALHATANDLFTLLAGTIDGRVRSDEELAALLDLEYNKRFSSATEEQVLPVCAEDRLPLPSTRFQSGAVKVDFENQENRLIGGQAFPRRKSDVRQTVVPTISFPADITKRILSNCKSNGATISNALFALCNIAWARMLNKQQAQHPMMMYSALNIRSFFSPPSPSSSLSYWFLAVGYFNVVLPSFLPSSSTSEDDEKNTTAFAISRTFWHRARSAKVQSAKCVKSPLCVGRVQEMAKVRAARAIHWAKIDDEAEQKAEATKREVEGAAKLVISTTPSEMPLEKEGDALPSPPESPHMELDEPASDKHSESLLDVVADEKKKKEKTSTFSSITPPPTPDPQSTEFSLDYQSGSDVEDTSTPPPSPTPLPSPPLSTSTPIASTTEAPSKLPPAPSSALIGLSLLGNLDGTYKHASYPSLALHTLTTGSRQRQGGMLLFGYTFAGKLWISLGWDQQGFSEGVVERFWEEVKNGVDEFLVA